MELPYDEKETVTTIKIYVHGWYPLARNRPGSHYFRINISYQRGVDPFQVVRDMNESTWTDKPK